MMVQITKLRHQPGFAGKWHVSCKLLLRRLFKVPHCLLLALCMSVRRSILQKAGHAHIPVVYVCMLLHIAPPLIPVILFVSMSCSVLLRCKQCS